MKELSLAYFMEDANCSQCFLKAAHDKYGITYDKEVHQLLEGIHSGFGVGEFCSAVLGCIMVLGYFFDHNELLKYRLLLLSKIQEKYDCLQCGKLLHYCDKYGNCTDVVGFCAEVLEEIIELYRK